ncbi:MAG: peptidylprolyl isomerase [Clostridiales bacterium]|nr:peptidylprolyl isomerase [Clostridiales bacterium]
MKKIRISAVLMAMCISAGMCLSGCKQAKVQNTTGQSSSDASVSSDAQNSAASDVSASDSGLSFSVETGDPSTSANGTGGATTSFVKMSYEQNYDQAAIDEMGKVVTVKDKTFTAVDYNFYFANEYKQLLLMNMYGQASVPMTQAGFLDMKGKLTSDYTVAQYLQNSIVSDFQGEVWLLEFAQKKNLKLDDEINKKIESQFTSTKETAEGMGMTLDEYLQSFYGPDANADRLREILQRYELVNLAMKVYIEEYQFAEGETLLPTVYHVLFPSLDLTTGEALPDDKKAEAKKRAEDFKASVTSLDDMKAKAEAAVADKTAAEAAEYTVSLGQMVEPFEDWCFAEHQIGDVGFVETQYGYHVIYFVGKKEADDDQKFEIAKKAMHKEMNDAIDAGGYEATIK